MSSIDHPDFAAPVVAGALFLGTFTFTGVANGAGAKTPVLDVSSFGQVFVAINGPAFGPNQYSLVYSSDPAGVVTPFSAPTWFNNGCQTINMFSDPLAPYMAVQIFNQSGAARNYTVTVFGQTDHQDQRYMLPPELMGFPSNAFVAAGSAIEGVSPQSAGPASLFGTANSLAWAVQLQTWDGITWDTFAGVSGGAGACVTTAVILPFSDIRMVLVNQGAGANTVQGALVGVL